MKLIVKNEFMRKDYLNYEIRYSKIFNQNYIIYYDNEFHLNNRLSGEKSIKEFDYPNDFFVEFKLNEYFYLITCKPFVTNFVKFYFGF